MLDKTPPPPMIYITAFEEAGARAEAEKLGASGFLTEPFASADLISAIHRATRSNQLPASSGERARRS
jgi:CheY-like chemotaxis protein